jgi:enoyl-CoA hydratase/carnithine racemase
VSPARGPSRARRPPSRSPRAARGPAVERSVRDGVAWLTLARPATGNRLDAELCSALVEACAEVDEAAAVRVVVLAGAGRAFSLGLPRGCAWPERSWPDAVAAVAGLGKPVVAALHGEVVGWGLALALACDLRVAATDAVLRLPETRDGHLPGGGVTQRLPRMVGVARALELVLLGSRLGATAAVDWGLVSAAVAPARLHDTVAELAAALASRGPLALRLGKEAVVRALDLPLADGIRLEQDLYVLLQTTSDRSEGVRAFLERRRPRFGGR